MGDGGQGAEGTDARPAIGGLLGARSRRRRLTEARYRTLVEQSPMSIQVLAPDGTTVEVNRAWEALWGVRLADLPGYNILADPQLEANGVLPHLRRAFAGEAVQIPPVAYVPDRGAHAGQPRWVRAVAYPVLADDGRVEQVVLLHEDITSTQLAEDALRETEGRLRAVVALAPIVLFALDRAGRFTFSEGRGLAALGLAPGEVVGRSVFEVYAAEPAILGHARRALAGEDLTATAEVTSLGVVWETRWTPLRDAAGAVAGAVGVATDVTERERAQEGFRASQERLEMAQRAGRIGTFEWVVPEDRITWSAELEALYGLPPGGFGGTYGSWAATLHPEDRARAEAEVAAALAAGTELETEWRVVRPDRAVRWIAARAQILPGSGGADGDRPARMVGVNMDVTDRRRAEDRLRFLAGASTLLASSLDYEATLARVAELAVPDLADWCVVHVVADGGELRPLAIAHADPAKVADAWALQQRYPPDPEDPGGLHRVLRTGRSELYAEISDELLIGAARDADHLASLRAVGFSSAMIVPLVARDRPLGALTLVAAESGRRYGLDDLALAEDVARRAATAVDHARLYAEAQAAVRARDQFLSIAAHELRTPVAGIKGYAQMLRRLLDRARLDPARLDQGLATIDAATDRLTALTNDLLDVSRIRLGQLPLRPAPLDLAALAHEVADRAALRLDERHRLELDAPPPAPVLADHDRIEQVLHNLLDNAAKYSPDGGTVRIAVRPEGNGARLEVRDEGIGLPPGAAEAIFEPFGRAPNAATQNLPGLGLGLYICRDIVERHGGTIRAASPGEGRGTTFSLWLPNETADGGRQTAESM